MDCVRRSYRHADTDLFAAFKVLIASESSMNPMRNSKGFLLCSNDHLDHLGLVTGQKAACQ